MAAYSLDVRFRQSREQRPDPGDHQPRIYKKFNQNKAPFLSSTDRNVSIGSKTWTDNVYNPNICSHIPNCTSIRSKTPRFPYEALSKEDLEELLCRCGYPTPPCECPTENIKVPDVVCQGKVRKYLFKGPTLHTCFEKGISMPSKADQGFEIMPDGCLRRILSQTPHICPPFYDTRGKEYTQFYHGCKWSRWTSQRQPKSLEVRPGPADYTVTREPSQSQKCAEKVLQHRRKTSKLLRYLDMLQENEIREGRPGPATYSPQEPCYDFVQSTLSKQERFPESKHEVRPGPADHSIPREFDPAPKPENMCHARLPEPACFGIKADRFKFGRSKGPGPAEYDARYDPHILFCTNAPFGTSSKRFVDLKYDSEDEIEDVCDVKPEEEMVKCPKFSWMFKSRTLRMKPQEADAREPSAQPQHDKIRPLEMQYIAPFHTSESRFEPWYDWLPCYDKSENPGPAYYCLDKVRCLPAVNGPLLRATRFQSLDLSNPSPDAYDINRDLIIPTHNKRLKNNVVNQHKFHWKAPIVPVKLTYEQKQMQLLNKAIQICDVTDPAFLPDRPPGSDEVVEKSNSPKEEAKPKMLRCFLYKKQIPII